MRASMAKILMNEGDIMVWQKRVALDIRDNLNNRGWKVNSFSDQKDNKISLIAKKRILFFFKRTHLYFIKERIKKEDITEVERELDKQNHSYDGLWFAAKEMTNETIEYANKKNKIGLMELNFI